VELVIIGFACWLAYASARSIVEKAASVRLRRAHQRSDAERRRRDDEDAKTRCAMCAAPNREAHGCFAHAVGRIGRPAREAGRHGPKKKRWVPGRPATWLGVVFDRFGTGWQCDHHHSSMTEAKKCGQQHLRLHQYGDCRCFTIASRPPVGQPVPARRVPIADMTASAWRQMCEAAGYRCHYCGMLTERLHREHRVPLARGGANSIENIVPACGPCNLAKGILTDQEFIQMLAEKRSREVRLGLRAARMPTQQALEPDNSPAPGVAPAAQPAIAGPGRVVIVQQTTPTPDFAPALDDVPEPAAETGTAPQPGHVVVVHQTMTPARAAQDLTQWDVPDR
jgi:5-methylcytosine-specific restriction endonuclease McrA